MRIRSLDGLRGLAAGIVVIHHALLAVPILAAPYVTGDRASDPIARVMLYSPLHFLWEGRAAVYVFFILSGIVLTLPVLKAGPSFDYLAYYPQRLLRLYLPVWAAVVLGVLLLVAVPRDGNMESLWLQNRAWDLDLRSVLLDTTLLAGHGGLVSPLWSLRWEVWFSLLLPVFVFVGVRLAHVWWLVITLSVVAIAGSSSIPVPGLAYLPMFMIGVSLATVLPRIVASGRRLPKAFGWALVAFAILAMVSPWTGNFTLGANVGNAPFIALATVGALTAVYVALVFPPIQSLLESRPLQWLGLVSFSLYLVHEPIVISATYVFGDRLLWVGMVIGVLLSVVVAYVFYRVIEVPAHRLSRIAGDRIRDHQASRSGARAGLRP